MTCPWQHEDIDTLFGVERAPISQLPQTCGCGTALTYADVVAFVSQPVVTYEADPCMVVEDVKLGVVPFNSGLGVAPNVAELVRLVTDSTRRPDDRIDDVYRIFDGWHPSEMEAALGQIHPSGLETTILLSILTATLLLREHSAARGLFCRSVRKELSKRGSPSSVERWLSGLV